MENTMDLEAILAAIEEAQNEGNTNSQLKHIQNPFSASNIFYGFAS